MNRVAPVVGAGVDAVQGAAVDGCVVWAAAG